MGASHSCWVTWASGTPLAWGQLVGGSAGPTGLRGSSISQSTPGPAPGAGDRVGLFPSPGGTPWVENTSKSGAAAAVPQNQSACVRGKPEAVPRLEPWPREERPFTHGY